MIGTLRRKYQEAKAELTGQAISKARLIKRLVDIDQGRLKDGPAQPTGVVLKMLDGQPMMYYSDGSLRRVLGKKRPHGVSARQMRRAVKARRRGEGYRIHVKRDSWSPLSQ